MRILNIGRRWALNPKPLFRRCFDGLQEELSVQEFQDKVSGSETRFKVPGAGFRAGCKGLGVRCLRVWGGDALHQNQHKVLQDFTFLHGSIKSVGSLMDQLVLALHTISSWKPLQTSHCMTACLSCKQKVTIRRLQVESTFVEEV